jgi:hypothetical protein
LEPTPSGSAQEPPSRCEIEGALLTGLPIVVEHLASAQLDGDERLTIGPQHPANLFERLHLRLGRKVMKRCDRHDAIDAVIGDRHTRCIGTDHRRLAAPSSLFQESDGEIQPNRHTRDLTKCGQVSTRATTDVENGVITFDC